MESTNAEQHKPEEDRFERFGSLRKLIGGWVAIQEKIGPVVSGVFAEFRDGYLRIEDVAITGKKYKAKPAFVLVHQSAVAHIHPEVETEKAWQMSRNSG
jgi:hypothetical protein